MAKAALRRKKLHEKNLEQTQAQIMQLEQHVYTIEAANINQETLQAMNQASEAMKRMHAGLTMDKVDEMMYEIPSEPPSKQIWMLMQCQGQNPGTATTRRRNLQRNHQQPRRRATRRGRTTSRAGRAGTGGHGRANAQDWHGPGGRSTQSPTNRSQRRE